MKLITSIALGSILMLVGGLTTGCLAERPQRRAGPSGGATAQYDVGGYAGSDATEATDDGGSDVAAAEWDAGSRAESDSDDALSVDAGGVSACNVVTWEGCGANEGCYWDDGPMQAMCLPLGSLARNAECDASKLNACGKGDLDEPLLCDSVDKKCYPLCDTTDSDNCDAGETCYTLQDSSKNNWPDNAGICAK